jgi:hypothetical protein
MLTPTRSHIPFGESISACNVKKMQKTQGLLHIGSKMHTRSAQRVPCYHYDAAAIWPAEIAKNGKHGNLPAHAQAFCLGTWASALLENLHYFLFAFHF